MEQKMAFMTERGKALVLGQYEEFLMKLTAPHERRMIQTRCGETHVISAGREDAPPVILLHGSSMNSGMWISDIPILSAGYRVYAPDLPGEPGKSDGRQLAFEGDAFSNWLLDVYQSLRIERALLVGASLGGFVAAKFAIAHPQRVMGLALLCPAGIGGQNHAFKDIAMELLPKGEQGVNELFRMINGGSPIPEEVLDYQKRIAMNFNARQEPIPGFADEQLLRLQMPGIVFVGDGDIMLRSDETVERVSRLLPHWRTVVLPGRGHSLAGLGGDIAKFFASEQGTITNLPRQNDSPSTESATT